MDLRAFLNVPKYGGGLTAIRPRYPDNLQKGHNGHGLMAFFIHNSEGIRNVPVGSRDVLT